MEIFEAVIIGGGTSGATAAHNLAKSGKKVAFIDKAGRIKPCGGAIPPRLILDFDIPDSQVVAKIKTARMISPTARKVDMPIENGFVGMVDRENFDDFLRDRACRAGATQFTGTFLKISRPPGETLVHFKDKKTGEERTLQTRALIAADGARSNVMRAEMPGGREIPYVIAYHEIVKAPTHASYDPD